MSVFLSQSTLGQCDLRLRLTNENGHKVSPQYVKWTIFDTTGKKISGHKLLAAESRFGDFYAPWKVCAPHGCYKIVWNYKIDGLSPERTVHEDFFVIDYDKYRCNGQLDTIVNPDPCCNTYMIGSVLGRGDLPLFLKDGNGIPTSAHSVTWQIFNEKGCAVTYEKTGAQVVVGEYYADWFVNIYGGNYTINWKVVEELGSPATVFKHPFSVISPDFSICVSRGMIGSAPIDPTSTCLVPLSFFGSSCGYGFVARNCSLPCSSQIPQVPIEGSNMSACCPFEVSRVVHLTEQNLPIGGGFTTQPVYHIPSKIRNITYYVRYRRGMDGGKATFKLLWGNGTEETQSTLLDLGYANATEGHSEQDMFLATINGPAPQNDEFISFQIETSAPAGSTTTRLLASECGQPTQPGIISITLTASS